jgi:hypothetical protein
MSEGRDFYWMNALGAVNAGLLAHPTCDRR